MERRGLRRPDKGRPCARHVCSASAGSRKQVLTQRGSKEEMLLKGEGGKQPRSWLDFFHLSCFTDVESDLNCASEPELDMFHLCVF